MKTETDPREMRKVIQRAMRGDRVDRAYPEPWSFSPVAPIIRAVLHAGEAEGWSGEDVMTALAYHALLRCEALYDAALVQANTHVPERIILRQPQSSEVR